MLDSQSSYKCISSSHVWNLSYSVYCLSYSVYCTEIHIIFSILYRNSEHSLWGGGDVVWKMEAAWEQSSFYSLNNHLPYESQFNEVWYRKKRKKEIQVSKTGFDRAWLQLQGRWTLEDCTLSPINHHITASDFSIAWIIWPFWPCGGSCFLLPQDQGGDRTVEEIPKSIQNSCVILSVSIIVK